jgi:hypothetical protein
MKCPRCKLEVTIALVGGSPVETVPVGGRLLMLRVDAVRGAVCVGQIAGDVAAMGALHAVARVHECGAES